MRRSSSAWYSGQTRGSCSTSAPAATAASKNARTAARSVASNAKWIGRFSPPSLSTSIQKSGFPPTPYPMASSKFMMRSAPSVASTTS